MQIKNGLSDHKDADWDFGTAAGFYLDATNSPWDRNYRMYSYVVNELPGLIEATFPAHDTSRGIFGHSMGGHGALTIALKNPGRYQSVSAFAPICAPLQCPWGHKALGNYLGTDQSQWAQYDACELVRNQASQYTLLVDQGLADQFLDEQLKPDLLEAACAAAGQPLKLRRHEGYDHSYYFIQTFMGDHIAHHAAELKR